MHSCAERLLPSLPSEISTASSLLSNILGISVGAQTFALCGLLILPWKWQINVRVLNLISYVELLLNLFANNYLVQNRTFLMEWRT